MSHRAALTAVSLLALLLLVVHMTHDVLGQHEGAVLYPIPVAVFGQFEQFIDVAAGSSLEHL